MGSLEEVFIREFKQSIRMSKKDKNIYSLPLPEGSEAWEVSGSVVYAVKGITSDTGGLYTKLNKSFGKRIPKNVVPSKRKVDLVTRNFMKDSSGKFIYEDVKIPTNSIVIVSKENLELPFNYKAPFEGFGYIDFIGFGADKEYLYYIPKSCVYETNQTALALSVKNMKNFSGKGYLTWDYGTVYLHIVPYKPNTNYVGTKILKTGLNLNYSKEIKSIIDYWIAEGVIPNIALCETISEGNLVMKPTNVGYYDYTPVSELSVGEKEVYGSEFETESEEVEDEE